jgi:hypothetical protein
MSSALSIGHQSQRSWRSMLAFLATDDQHHSNRFKESAFLLLYNGQRYTYKVQTQNLKLKK